jgi:D-xylose transport system permease protein
VAFESSSVVVKSNEELKPSLKLWVLEGLGDKFRLAPVFAALLIIWLVFSFLHPNFLSPRNLTNLSIQIVNTAIVALGLFFVLVLGEIDLSVSMLGAVCATVSAIFTVQMGWPVGLSFLAGILTGCIFGFIHGMIVTRFSAPAFIVTLGGQLALNGVLLMILPAEKMISLVGLNIGRIATTYIPTAFSICLVFAAALLIFFLSWQSYGQAKKNGIKTNFLHHVLLPALIVTVNGLAIVFFLRLYKGLNLSLIILIVLMGICFYICQETRFGVYIFAIGGNPEAVQRAGINVKKVKLTAFIISSAIIAIGGIISASRVQGVSAASGDSDIMMNAIAAAVLGGASLAGGRGNIWGILLGALVIGSISNGMFLIGAETYLRLIIQGTILILAIILDSVIVKASSTKK